MPERTLVVWCPDWPVMAAGIPAAEPAAVVHANRVIACTPAARAEGVRPGLRRREAQGRCPELEVIEHDPARDARAFEPVAAAFETLVPRVEVVRPGTCAIPARGASRYHGGDRALVARTTEVVDAALGPRGRCQIGIADGLFAATLAARRAVVVAPGGTPELLASMPVSALERPELADLLLRLGLRTLGDLAALPAGDVGTRFGPEGVRAHRLASGLDERPLAPRRPPPELIVATVLEPPAERVETAAFAAKALADDLHGRLDILGLSCTRIRIEAETEHGERLTRVWRSDVVGDPDCDAGSFSAAAVAERVRWQLDGWLAGAARSRPTGGISLLRLIPDEVSGAAGRQLGFWGGDRQADERATRALARVQGLLGAEAVVMSVLTGGRGPADRVTHALPLGAEPAPAMASTPDAPVPVPRSASFGAGRRLPGAPEPGGGAEPEEGARRGGAGRAGSQPGTGGPGPGLGGPGRVAPDGGTTGDRGPRAGRSGPRAPGGPGSSGLRGAVAVAAPSPALFGSAVRFAASVGRPARRATRAAHPAGTGLGHPAGTGARAWLAGAPGGDAPWPGQVPAPAPATVHARPLTAELLDGEGAVVTVSSRGVLELEPARLWVAGGPWVTITGWAGPWPADGRWWDSAGARRRDRFQVVTHEGAAHLLMLTEGRWWVEASYD